MDVPYQPLTVRIRLWCGALDPQTCGATPAADASDVFARVVGLRVLVDLGDLLGEGEWRLGVCG